MPLRTFAKVSTDTIVAALGSKILVHNVPNLYFEVHQLHLDRRMHMPQQCLGKLGPSTYMCCYAEPQRQPIRPDEPKQSCLHRLQGWF